MMGVGSPVRFLGGGEGAVPRNRRMGGQEPLAGSGCPWLGALLAVAGVDTSVGHGLVNSCLLGSPLAVGVYIGDHVLTAFWSSRAWTSGTVCRSTGGCWS